MLSPFPSVTTPSNTIHQMIDSFALTPSILQLNSHTQLASLNFAQATIFGDVCRFSGRLGNMSMNQYHGPVHVN